MMRDTGHLTGGDQVNLILPGISRKAIDNGFGGIGCRKYPPIVFLLKLNSMTGKPCLHLGRSEMVKRS